MNLFAYCQCDPVNKADPSGHMGILFALLLLGVIGAVAGFTAQTVSDLSSKKGFDWGRSGIAAGAGFISTLCYAIPFVGSYLAPAVFFGFKYGWSNVGERKNL